MAALTVVEGVRHAQANAQAGKDGSAWGVAFLADTIIVFKGAQYAERDAARDQVVALPPGVSVTGVSEIGFSGIVGANAMPGTVMLANAYGEKHIVINEKGVVTYY